MRRKQGIFICPKSGYRTIYIANLGKPKIDAPSGTSNSGYQTNDQLFCPPAKTIQTSHSDKSLRCRGRSSKHINLKTHGHKYEKSQKTFGRKK
ncbi:UNVERIFIED_CONTAM: hypothetical protein NCL1_11469 [Trichonephila clavipes]